MGKKQIIYYSLLAFPLGFLTIPIYIYLPSFYNDNFDISLQNIGLILLISRAFDAIIDPILGIFSDKYQHFKKQIIVISAPFLGIGFILVFHPLATQNITLWIFCSLFITYFLFSLIQINYQSLAVEIGGDYNQKTRIVALREAFGVIGIIFASIAPTFLFFYFTEIKSFLFIGIFYFFVISIFAIIFYYKTPNNLVKINQKQITFWDFSFLYNKKLKLLLKIFFFNGCTFAITSSLMLFFVENILNAKSFSGLFLVLYFFGLLFGIAFFAKISQILNNKEKAWSWSVIAIIIAFSFCSFLKEGDIVLYAIICLFSGFFFGGDYCLSYSILTDIIQSENLKKSNTTIFGVINFIIKICLAATSGILIFWLGWFQENMPEFQHSFLLISYCLLPCCFKVLTYFFLKKLQKTYD